MGISLYFTSSEPLARMTTLFLCIYVRLSRDMHDCWKFCYASPKIYFLKSSLKGGSESNFNLLKMEVALVCACNCICQKLLRASVGPSLFIFVGSVLLRLRWKWFAAGGGPAFFLVCPTFPLLCVRLLTHSVHSMVCTRPSTFYRVSNIPPSLCSVADAFNAFDGVYTSVKSDFLRRLWRRR